MADGSTTLCNIARAFIPYNIHRKVENCLNREISYLLKCGTSAEFARACTNSKQLITYGLTMGARGCFCMTLRNLSYYIKGYVFINDIFSDKFFACLLFFHFMYVKHYFCGILKRAYKDCMQK